MVCNRLDLVTSFALVLALAPAAAAQSSTSLPSRPAAARAPVATTALVNSPSDVVVNQVGGALQLRVFQDDGVVQTEVTGDPGLGFQSSNPGVVSVTPGGLMSFTGVGQAQVTASLGTQSAVTTVDVDPAKMPAIETQIGSAGGSLHFADGTGVEVPPGALSSAQAIRVEETTLPGGTVLPAGSSVVSKVYDFTPSGLTFSGEATVTLAYDPLDVPVGFSEESLLVHTMYGGARLDVEARSGPDGDEHLVESVNQPFDPVARTVSVGATHFSCRALLANLNPTPATLTAPDGSSLDVLQRLKTEKPNKGPDNDYGVPNCDDDGNGVTDDCSEFEGVAGSACGTMNIDDVRVAIPTRTSNQITHIVLHSTAGAAGTSFRGEVSWASNGRNCYWAQYYVGKDGTIVQVSADTEIAQHVKPNNTMGHAGFGINNTNSIGIEIYNNTGVDNYPGRQVAAVARLVDHLLRTHPTIVRPSAGNPTGNIIVHAEQNPPGSVKTDPAGNFRTAAMGSPSLQEIVVRAMRTDTLTGIVNASGGDALGAALPGAGGNVTFETGDPALANDFDDNRTSVQVATGATQALAAGDHMHVLVDGTATVTADTLADLDGILYVGPQGTLDARGGTDGNDGFDLTFTADGFALIEGRVLVNGTSKLGSNEKPPFDQPPFGGGSGNGPGGNAGDFSFRSAAAGFQFVPSIVTRGGDGDAGIGGSFVDGGAGGNVTVRARLDANGDRVITLLRGRQNDLAADQAEVGMPDYLPQPSPFNLMPIITATPIASGTCPASTSSTSSYIRPTSGERLALGRDIDATSHQALGNISPFNRGIVTVGGMGAVAASSSDLGDALGRALIVNGVEHSIVGVAPRSFRGVAVQPAQVYLPTMMLPVAYRWCPAFENPDCAMLRLYGRLANGASLENARAEVAAKLPERWRGDDPERMRGASVRPERGTVLGLQDRGLVRLLAWMAGLLVLVCCANLAGLQLSRARNRARALAIRHALGASPARIVRQLQTEAFVIAAAGAVLGLVFALALAAALGRAFYGTDGTGRPLSVAFTLSPGVAATAVVLALAAGTLFGLLPALAASRSAAGGLRLRSAFDRRRRSSRWLVGAQAALALALVAVAALLSSGAYQILRGASFDPSHVALLRLRPRLVGFGPGEAEPYLRRVLESVRKIPGVESASMFRLGSPLRGPAADVAVPGGLAVRAGLLEVGPDYFETLSIPLLAGRALEAGDRVGAPLVAVVSSSLAEALWPGRSPLGRTLEIGGVERSVVGLAADVGLESRAEGPAHQAYVAYWQSPRRVDARLLVRVAGDPGALLETWSGSCTGSTLRSRSRRWCRCGAPWPASYGRSAWARQRPPTPACWPSACAPSVSSRRSRPRWPSAAARLVFAGPSARPAVPWSA